MLVVTDKIFLKNTRLLFGTTFLDIQEADIIQSREIIANTVSRRRHSPCYRIRSKRDDGFHRHHSGPQCLRPLCGRRVIPCCASARHHPAAVRRVHVREQGKTLLELMLKKVYSAYRMDMFEEYLRAVVVDSFKEPIRSSSCSTPRHRQRYFTRRYLLSTNT